MMLSSKSHTRESASIRRLTRNPLGSPRKPAAGAGLRVLVDWETVCSVGLETGRRTFLVVVDAALSQQDSGSSPSLADYFPRLADSATTRVSGHNAVAAAAEKWRRFTSVSLYL